MTSDIRIVGQLEGFLLSRFNKHDCCDFYDKIG